MKVTINTRYRVNRYFVPALHQVVGPDYRKVLGPQIASEMREVIAQFTAEQVYVVEHDGIPHDDIVRVSFGIMFEHFVAQLV